MNFTKQIQQSWACLCTAHNDLPILVFHATMPPKNVKTLSPGKPSSFEVADILLHIHVRSQFNWLNLVMVLSYLTNDVFFKSRQKWLKNINLSLFV